MLTDMQWFEKNCRSTLWKCCSLGTIRYFYAIWSFFLILVFHSFCEYFIISSFYFIKSSARLALSQKSSGSSVERRVELVFSLDTFLCHGNSDLKIWVLFEICTFRTCLGREFFLLFYFIFLSQFHLSWIIGFLHYLCRGFNVNSFLELSFEFCSISN